MIKYLQVIKLFDNFKDDIIKLNKINEPTINCDRFYSTWNSQSQVETQHQSRARELSHWIRNIAIWRFRNAVKRFCRKKIESTRKYAQISQRSKARSTNQALVWFQRIEN